jgi:hypothetical protein
LSHSRSATKEQEKIILKLFKKDNYGPKRMMTNIKRILAKSDEKNKLIEEIKCLANITPAQIRGVYKRNKLKTKKIRSARG